MFKKDILDFYLMKNKEYWFKKLNKARGQVVEKLLILKEQ